VTVSPEKVLVKRRNESGVAQGGIDFGQKAEMFVTSQVRGKRARTDLSVNLGAALLFLSFVCSNLFSQIASGESFRIE